MSSIEKAKQKVSEYMSFDEIDAAVGPEIGSYQEDDENNPPVAADISKEQEDLFQPLAKEAVPDEIIKNLEDNADEDDIEIDKHDDKKVKRKEHFDTPQVQLDNLVKTFYEMSPFGSNSKELEVRFGDTKGIRPLTKNDYDNVIKKLKSLNFVSSNEQGEYSLRIQHEYNDTKYGVKKLSDIRTEINSLYSISDYCKTGDVKTMNKRLMNFTSKRKLNNEKGDRIFPVRFNDFNFRVSLQGEEEPKIGTITYIKNTLHEAKKTFRFMNRVTYSHPDHPVKVDISIVKYGNKKENEYHEMVRVYNVADSNVFNNPETYEIEIEVDNNKIGPGTAFNTPELLLESIRKVIKFVLGGLQGTNYPISYKEQNQVLESYMKLVWDKDYNPSARVNSAHFIGPNSITLQMENIAQLDENSTVTSIRNDYTVTDKADGDRHLMYVGDDGKIYMITTGMSVVFTGAKTQNKSCFGALLDGELIRHNKNGEFINLYAAFDMYYYKKDGSRQDIRSLPFMPMDHNISKSRLNLLKQFVNSLKPVSIETVKSKHHTTAKDLVQSLKSAHTELISPVRITTKEFYSSDKATSIFQGCSNILNKEKEQLFEYEIDGLIFTPSYFGVGAEKTGVAGKTTRTTWKKSFKWKPPKYNTIDFLVTTVKEKGVDVIKNLTEDGLQMDGSGQISEYKVIELRCTFDRSDNSYVNPCQDVIDDKLPEFKYQSDDEDESKSRPKPKSSPTAVRFYPTEPYDPDAGICNILLKKNAVGDNKMFTHENEAFDDNTSVEFSYDLDARDGWKWVPLRVRYDKTTEMLKSFRNFGNAYHVANDNWKSIHNPIHADMISTGMNIPDVSVSDDKYYNDTSKTFKTDSMKAFHNLFVKKILILSASKQSGTLIDFACGKAGDLPKWIASKLSFVFGVDINKDNIENRQNGACARFLNYKKNTKYMPYALFVNGNSSLNVRSGKAMLDDKAVQITNAVFGIGSKDEKTLGKGVIRQYGKGENGFNVSSCQFALHYFLESIDTLKGFLRNVAECTATGGYFIGTAYDGKKIFNMLKDKKKGDGERIIVDGERVWEVTKAYDSNVFENDATSIGYQIDVYQDSINKTFPEYLVNFDYLERVMEMYGFKLVTPDDEILKKGLLPNSSGSFEDLFNRMREEIKHNRYKAKEYGLAPNMSYYEKRISFMNMYFVYKKIRHVNVDTINLDLAEDSSEKLYEEVVANAEANAVANAEAVVPQKSEPKKKSATTKLKTKAKLTIDDDDDVEVVKPKKKVVKKATKLIIEDDE